MAEANTSIDSGSGQGEPHGPLDTELRVQHAAKSKLDAVADHLPAMVGYWNRDLHCEFANSAYLEWFGLAPEKVIGMHMMALQGEALFRLNEPHARMALSGRAQRFERAIVKADGSAGYTDARYIPDHDAQGNVRGFFVLVSEITELHNACARVRELAQRLESAREDERRSVANSLHEGIAQDLFASTLALRHLKSKIVLTEEGRVAANELAALIERCIAHTRKLASDLHPPALDQLSLLTILERHARYIESLSALQIQVAQVGPFPLLDEGTRLICFRAAQEAVTNVVRHAQASKLNITLRAGRDGISLEVVDDGIGMPDGATRKPGSLGLLGIRERFEAAGGGLSVESQAPAGTKLTVHLPHPHGFP